jgi:uncharacterized membrane protein
MIGTFCSGSSSSRDPVPTSGFAGMLHEIWTLDLTMSIEASLSDVENTVIIQEALITG